MKDTLTHTTAEDFIRAMCDREGCDFDKDKGVPELDYAAGCYRSALKAYEAVLDSLSEDGHSGTSYIITREILSNLILASVDTDSMIIRFGDKYFKMSDDKGN